MAKDFNLYVLTIIFLSLGIGLHAQPAVTCASIGSRSNGNGQMNQCPNNGAPMATNFTGTTYAAVPAGAKTADITFRYSNSSTALLPYAITKIYITTNGVTSVFANTSGPAGQPVQSGQDVLVKYCVYGSANLPTAGLLSFELSDPQTGLVKGACSYDAACTSNCTTAANPVSLPLSFLRFDVRQAGSLAIIQWTTDVDDNVKGFEIEKSSDGSLFKIIGFVSYRPSSATESSYEFTDGQANANTRLYYRIKVINLDNVFYYSSVKVVHAAVAMLPVKVISNGKEIVVTQHGSLNHISISVYNTQGQGIYSKRTEEPSHTVRDLTPGLYHVRIQLNKESIVKKTIRIF